ncbi:MAG TPA: hypothetical protein VFW31_03490 [Candidatus Angelobacter sp.]|nr:hypothetical protein [Candidatus Angelobacter sp.]
MDILSLAAIRLQCSQCGEPYLVPLRDIALSHQVMHEGCPVAEETECPPLFQSRLASEWAVKTLDQAWRRLERRATAVGGELVLREPVTSQVESGLQTKEVPVNAKSAGKRKSKRCAA